MSVTECLTKASRLIQVAALQREGHIHQKALDNAYQFCLHANEQVLATPVRSEGNARVRNLELSWIYDKLLNIAQAYILSDDSSERAKGMSLLSRVTDLSNGLDMFKGTAILAKAAALGAFAAERI